MRRKQTLAPAGGVGTAILVKLCRKHLQFTQLALPKLGQAPINLVRPRSAPRRTYPDAMPAAYINSRQSAKLHCRVCLQFFAGSGVFNDVARESVEMPWSFYSDHINTTLYRYSKDRQVHVNLAVTLPVVLQRSHPL